MGVGIGSLIAGPLGAVVGAAAGAAFAQLDRPLPGRASPARLRRHAALFHPAAFLDTVPAGAMRR